MQGVRGFFGFSRGSRRSVLQPVRTHNTIEMYDLASQDAH